MDQKKIFKTISIFSILALMGSIPVDKILLDQELSIDFKPPIIPKTVKMVTVTDNGRTEQGSHFFDKI